MMAVADLVHGASAERFGGWHWNAPHRGEHFRRCSYCGCVHPEDLAAEPTWPHFEWADRQYGWPHKFYAELPNRTREQLFITGGCVQAREGPYAPGGEHFQEPWERYPGASWYRASGIPSGAITDGWEPLDQDWYTVGTRERHFAKFYSIHLNDPAVDPDAIAAIQRRSGLVFQFVDGGVSWKPYPQAEDH